MTSNAEAVTTPKRVEKKRHGFVADLFIRMIREKPLGTFGLVVTVLLFFTGVFADWLAPYGMNEIHLIDRLQGPSSSYLLGTDQLGRDILSRIIFGARISMIIGLGATTLAMTIEITIGATSGFLGGKFDLFVQRFVDVWMSMPALLVLMTVMSIIGNGMFQVIMVIGIMAGIRGSRVIRSAVIGIKENIYVQAAQSIGCSRFRTMIRHILPNIMAPIIINYTIGLGGAVMQEASLSFLGFGVPPGVPSWGSMLSGEGRQFMEAAPQLALWPGFALTLVIYGLNMFGDSLRDLLDPRLRGGVGRYTLDEKAIDKLRKKYAGSPDRNK
jgi:peptide/nickel transport system permease protein